MKRVLSPLTIVILLSLPALAADYRFTTIDYPVNAGTTVLDKIDNVGRILGYYGPGVLGSGPLYGFLLDRGIFSPVNFPGATQTYPGDMTLSGEIIGDIDQVSDGFVLVAGAYTQVDAPGNVGTTVLSGINERRHIVGFTYANSAPYYTGFLLDGGTFTTLPQYPDSVGTLPVRINNSGRILGEWVPPFSGNFVVSPFHGFLLKDGTFTDLEDPLEGTTNCDIVANPFGFEYCSTGPLGLNDREEIVGWYTANDGSAHGFLLSKGVWTTIDVPGALATECISINDPGEIVGIYYDSGACSTASSPHGTERPSEPVAQSSVSSTISTGPTPPRCRICAHIMVRIRFGSPGLLRS